MVKITEISTQQVSLFTKEKLRIIHTTIEETTNVNFKTNIEIMIESSNQTSKLFEKLETYGNVTFKLATLKILEKASKIIAILLTQLTLVIMIFLFVIVFSIGVSLLIGDLLGKSYYGFFIVSSAYLLIAILLKYFLHSYIKNYINESIVNHLSNQE